MEAVCLQFHLVAEQVGAGRVLVDGLHPAAVAPEVHDHHGAGGVDAARGERVVVAVAAAGLVGAARALPRNSREGEAAALTVLEPSNSLHVTANATNYVRPSR